ncbi:MAG: hypothetical protein AAGB48_10265 [Planctomycetota bacterium]
MSQHGRVSRLLAAGTTARAAALVLALGMVALGLLSLRQSRLQAMHELSAARLRQADQDDRLLELRSRITALVTPERIAVARPDPDTRAW